MLLLYYYIDRAGAITNEHEKYEDFDILDWCKSQGKTYPVFSNTARDILTPPVSTVVSEFVFSAGLRVLIE